MAACSIGEDDVQSGSTNPPKGLSALALLALFSIGSAPLPPPIRSPVEIVSDTTLPAALSEAVDLRWAGDGSIYFALFPEGTAEAQLENLGAPPKILIPGRDKPDGFWMSRQVAAGTRHLVVAAAAFSLTWRRLDAPTRQEEAFSYTVDIDAQRDRLLILGARKDYEKDIFSPDGAIAWIGSLSKDLKDLRPFLYDAEGPGARNMAACAPAELGAVRFLPDGSFLVVPGIQPGVLLYNSEARLIRSWDTASLGIDTDCASRRAERAAQRGDHLESRTAWLNRRRVVDDIVLLPSGPALIVRSVEQGQPRWELKVLDVKGGGFSTVSLPLRSDHRYARLRADARSDKLLFLIFHTLPAGAKPVPSRLIVAKAPPLTEGGRLPEKPAE